MQFLFLILYADWFIFLFMKVRYNSYLNEMNYYYPNEVMKMEAFATYTRNMENILHVYVNGQTTTNELTIRFH